MINLDGTIDKKEKKKLAKPRNSEPAHQTRKH